MVGIDQSIIKNSIPFIERVDVENKCLECNVGGGRIMLIPMTDLVDYEQALQDQKDEEIRETIEIAEQLEQYERRE